MYEGVSEATAGQLLRVPADEEEKSALTEAKEFLLSELGRFPVLANAVKRSAREADISERTLKRAKQALGVKSVKESDGSWTWSLPSEKAEGGQSSIAGTLGLLAPLARMPTLKATIPHTYGKKAKRAKWTTGSAASTTILAA